MTTPTIIVPCAGRSNKFPNVRPKYFLINPNGHLILQDAISQLPIHHCSVIITVPDEYEKKYHLKRVFKKIFNGKVKVCTLKEPTKSQSETVYKTIKKTRVRGPFLIKDADNIFHVDSIKESYNYITVDKLENFAKINARNKSYVSHDSSGIVTNIEEKKVISNTFSVGGYYFLDELEFITAYKHLEKDKSISEIYVSTVINYLISQKISLFKVKYAKDYVDFDTIQDWIEYKNKQRTYLIDIDGVIVKNSGEHFEPLWGDTEAIEKNAKVVRELYHKGNQIVLITSRPEAAREITEKQLKINSIPYHKLLMGLYHNSTRILINDFTNSNPYPSALSVNIPRDSDDLDKFLNSIHE